MKPLASVKIRGRTTNIDLYKIDTKDNSVIIGINDTAKREMKLFTDTHGQLYFRHGNTKYYITEFEGSSHGGKLLI